MDFMVVMFMLGCYAYFLHVYDKWDGGDD